MPLDHPHDSLFRFTFRRPDLAREHFQQALPPAVVDAVDWDTLEPRPESFLDDHLKKFQSDILYRAQLTGGGELYLYLLLEHQSSPDPLMPFRILQYMVRIWESWLKDHPGRLPLPFIWPMVLYNGQKPWTISTQFQDLFPPELLIHLAAQIPAFIHQLQDLSQIPDEELSGAALRELVLRLLKWGKRDELWQRFPAWMDAVVAIARNPHEGLRAIETVLRYLIEVAPVPPPPEIRRLLNTELPENTEEILMSWAEQLKREGRQEGLREGIEKGRQEGIEAGLERSRQRFLSMLSVKFSEIPDSARARIQTASEEDLDRWTTEIFAAKTIEDLLRG